MICLCSEICDLSLYLYSSTLCNQDYFCYLPCSSQRFWFDFEAIAKKTRKKLYLLIITAYLLGKKQCVLGHMDVKLKECFDKYILRNSTSVLEELLQFNNSNCVQSTSTLQWTLWDNLNCQYSGRQSYLLPLSGCLVLLLVVVSSFVQCWPLRELILLKILQPIKAHSVELLSVGLRQARLLL